MKKLIASIAFLAISVSLFAQDVNKMIKQDDVERIIKTLADDNMQGRGTFTPGIEKAAQFIESEYKKIGLQPLEGATGYRQSFSLTRIIPVKLMVSINGKVLPKDSVTISTTSTSVSWNNNSDVQIAQISGEKNFIAEYRNYLKTGKKMIILVDPKFSDIFKRLADRNKMAGMKAAKDDGQQLIFILGSYNIKSFEVSYETKTEDSPLFNVAGMIPGKTRPNEFVVFSGHYDHLGILKPMGGDSIANGADDDASGTTAVISLAKYYKQLNNNARTLIFVAFTAEEIGGYGSQHFSKLLDPDKVVAMFNIEMIGKPSKFGQNSAFITGFERSDFGTILQKNLQGTAFKFYPDPYPEQNLFYRSDNATLAALGVPAHTISTDQIDIDNFYHTVKDEVSTLDMANIASTIRAIALSSRTIVSGQDTPKRIPKLEQKND